MILASAPPMLGGSDLLPGCMRLQFCRLKALQSSLKGLPGYNYTLIFYEFADRSTSLQIFQLVTDQMGLSAIFKWGLRFQIPTSRIIHVSECRLKHACAYRVRSLNISNEVTDVRSCKIQGGDYRCMVNQHLGQRQSYRCTVKQPRREMNGDPSY